MSRKKSSRVAAGGHEAIVAAMGGRLERRTHNIATANLFTMASASVRGLDIDVPWDLLADIRFDETSRSIRTELNAVRG